MRINEQLKELGAPNKVVEAGLAIEGYLKLGKLPPRDLLDYVQKWVRSNNTQERYGH